MSKKSDFLVMHEMSKNNMDIACAIETTNFQRHPKRGGGTVTIGVASPHFDHLINQAASGEITHHAILYIVNKKQYDEIKNKPDALITEEFLLKLGWVKDTRLNNRTFQYTKSSFFEIEINRDHGCSDDTIIYDEFGYHDGMRYSGPTPTESEYHVLAKMLKIHD
jgi:hypothetical protein